jgi:mannose-6-phosphate isomerase-like protein (cupin superfamily)
MSTLTQTINLTMKDIQPVPPPDVTITTSRRHDVQQLQAVMATMPQFEPETEHYFADGMYCRVVARPAGAVIVGKTHKREHFYMVVQGAVAVVQDGAEEKVYRAPAIIVSKPGTKRAVVALEDSVCLTVHRTNETDLAKIEAELIEHDPTALFGPDNKLKVLEHKT